jgi:hypothetical protein
MSLPRPTYSSADGEVGPEISPTITFLKPVKIKKLSSVLGSYYQDGSDYVLVTDIIKELATVSSTINSSDFKNEFDYTY